MVVAAAGGCGGGGADGYPKAEKIWRRVWKVLLG